MFHRLNHSILSATALASLLLIASQAQAQTDSIAPERRMDDVVVHGQQSLKADFRTENTDLIDRGNLIRAACCNLGESFTTNPSVDVSYSDAATGARQIKLLGLSGTYVQMLTENIPNLRGASIPYALGYVPGPWMQSIQVSKGASSVKNGYESTTGQINIEFLKPQAIDGVRANAYLDSKLKQEINADGSIHLNDRLSTSLLLHFENRQTDHDSNHDGFMDMPRQRQYNGMWRMAYVSPLWISQFSMRALRDERESGMSRHHADMLIPHYGVSVETSRYEAQWKNGFTLNADRNASIALMLHGSWHDADHRFGNTQYDVLQKNGYAQLMYEDDLAPNHNLALGASLNHDHYTQHLIPNTQYLLPNTQYLLPNTQYLIPNTQYLLPNTQYPREANSETTCGFYAQYTYKLDDRLTVMPGIRWDHSSVYGSFVTPRLHIKYTPAPWVTLRASAGKGYRTPHALAENVSLLASSRTFHFADQLQQEAAWNYGLSVGMHLPICGKELELNAEYYYTDFLHQLVINVDGAKGPHTVSFENLDGRSYSHTLQVDATYPFFQGFTATGAFRWNDARTTYDGVLRRRPLTSLYKGLLTLSYKTPLELWQFDLTGQLNGRGKLYNGDDYPTHFQLQAQVTREFRLCSLYVGGENLTNYRIPNPILGASNPWGPTFDATQVWGPTDGAMAYIGIRFKLEKM